MTELQASPRKQLGKQVKNLRNEGLLPAVLYGEGVETQPLVLGYKDFGKVYAEAGESSIVKLMVENKAYNVLIHDISYDAYTGKTLHADFHAVRMDKLIRTHVALEFTGESSAVKNDGGILVKVLQELEVEALPQDLPHALLLDMTILAALESKALVKDIVLPKGVKVLTDMDEIIAIVETPRTTDELTALDQTGAAEVTAVKTEQEEKREAKAEVATSDTEE